MVRILVVDDEERMRQLLVMMLERAGYEAEEAADGSEALEKLRAEPFDLVISDIKMPGLDGNELLRTMKDDGILTPVVFITAFATVDSAVEAMKAGAVDYITKPFEEERILLSIQRSLHLSRLMAENRELKEKLKKTGGDGEIVYVSDDMQRVMALADKVSSGSSVVLLHGESGTGKELLAKYIHRQSENSEGRFVPVNCAAISPGLIESELFGHVKGAFTGADKTRIGKFEYADKGTVFLDEIGELPLEAQAKILRTLQDQKIQKVGGNRETDIHTRIICATNQDLERLVSEGKFRKDLFYRINVFPIELPPLRQRKADIVPLSLYFLDKLGDGEQIELSEGARNLLRQYNWPGNVRELANVMERAYILSRDQGTVTVSALSFLQHGAPEEKDDDFSLSPDGLDLEEMEKDLARQALDLAGDNQSAAARLLGLSRAKFRVLLKRLK